MKAQQPPTSNVCVVFEEAADNSYLKHEKCISLQQLSIYDDSFGVLVLEK